MRFSAAQARSGLSIPSPLDGHPLLFRARLQPGVHHFERCGGYGAYGGRRGDFYVEVEVEPARVLQRLGWALEDLAAVLLRAASWAVNAVALILIVAIVTWLLTVAGDHL